MRRGDEVRFGIEVVGGMPAEEVGVGERAELPAFHKGFQLRLHRLEAVRRRGARGNGGTDFGGLDRIGLKRAGHVHEVEGVQMVEMHDMVVQILHPEHEVPDVGGVLGDFHLNLAKPDWHHHHDHFMDSNPNVRWKETLEHAEKIGLGTREYELIKF